MTHLTFKSECQNLTLVASFYFIKKRSLSFISHAISTLDISPKAGEQGFHKFHYPSDRSQSMPEKTGELPSLSCPVPEAAKMEGRK